jgi:hypothetical protein
MTAPNPPLPQQIYLIRHGEKPADPPASPLGAPAAASGPPFGVDIDGNQNEHSLLPRGWQRCGALAALFDPAHASPPAGLRTPTALYSPTYGNPGKTQVHRTFQTIQGLGALLGLAIQSPLGEGQESALAEAILAGGGDVVLICWEHHRIPALAGAIPTRDDTTIPAVWPGDRFDVIWTFTLDPDTGRYAFGQVPQQLLHGDSATTI